MGRSAIPFGKSGAHKMSNHSAKMLSTGKKVACERSVSHAFVLHQKLTMFLCDGSPVTHLLIDFEAVLRLIIRSLRVKKTV